MSETQQKNRRVIGVSTLVVIGMFGFGFALIPLYDVMCDAFGINGRITAIEKGDYDGQAEAEKAMRGGVDISRTVDLQFMVTSNSELDLEFRPLTRNLTVNPGEVREVVYFVRNLTDRELQVQAIPGVTPSKATKYLAKIECFCFNKQTLKPGEAKEMPLRFVVNTAIPKNIPVMTLNYRFIDLNRSGSSGDVAQLGKTEIVTGLN